MGLASKGSKHVAAFFSCSVDEADTFFETLSLPFFEYQTIEKILNHIDCECDICFEFALIIVSHKNILQYFRPRRAFVY
jgi:hypothetical protein